MYERLPFLEQFCSLDLMMAPFMYVLIPNIVDYLSLTNLDVESEEYELSVCFVFP